MRSAVLLSTLSALVAAAPAPAPQNIDFDLVYALPNPTFTIATGVASQVINYDPSSIIDDAVAQITAEVSASATDAVITSAPTDASAATLRKRKACDPQPTGAKGAPTLTADTAAAFTDSAAFSSIAVNAPVPSGYVQRFSNLKASNNAYGYMGFTTLTSYDTNSCAKKCSAIKGCSSFNIYFERDPSLDPADACPNPSSYTMIKCVFWGGPVNTENAVNSGQWRNKFQVVIAGSNGYESALATPPGYNAPVALGGAINAPVDNLGFDTYLGVALFNSGPFDLKLCADACTMKSQYALAHPPSDGSPPVTCQFFNTYILYINNTQNPQGQYCAMYAESWSKSYATNTGQWRGNDQFIIRNSYSVSNATDCGSPSKGRAVYQASKDIAWNTLQPYCSTAAAAAVVTTKTVKIESTYTPVSSATATITVTGNGNHVKRDATITALPTLPIFQVGVNTTKTAPLSKRAVSTPDVLTKYPASIIASACGLYNITATTSTATVVSTCTITAPATTKTYTSVVTAASSITTTAAATTTSSPAASTTSTTTISSPAASTTTSAAISPASTTTSCTSTTSSPSATPTTTTTTTTSTSSSVATSSPSTTPLTTTTTAGAGYGTTSSSTTTTLSTTISTSAAATPTSFIMQVTTGSSAGQYISKDPFTTFDTFNLYTLTDRIADAVVFSLASGDGSALMQSDWKVQGALTSGLAYGGWGASPYGFDNGEDLICSVSKGSVSGGDGVECVTPSNGHNVFGECVAYSWMWLFDTVAEVNSFCPEGTGALYFKAVDSSAVAAASG